MYSPAAFPSYPVLSTFRPTVSDTGPQPSAATAVLIRWVYPKGLKPWFQKAWTGAKLIVDGLIAAFFFFYVTCAMHHIECEYIAVYSNGLSMSLLWSLGSLGFH